MMMDFIKDTDFIVAFVNTTEVPDEVRRHGAYKYSVSETPHGKEYRFFELVTNVYLYQNTIKYPVLDWQEVVVPKQLWESTAGIIDMQKMITAVSTQ
jgi:hypothetical protein